jgi:hypothetical protein
MKPSRAAQAVMDDDLKNFFETAASSDMLEIEARMLARDKATKRSSRNSPSRWWRITGRPVRS